MGLIHKLCHVDFYSFFIFYRRKPSRTENREVMKIISKSLHREKIWMRLYWLTIPNVHRQFSEKRRKFKTLQSKIKGREEKSRLYLNYNRPFPLGWFLWVWHFKDFCWEDLWKVERFFSFSRLSGRKAEGLKANISFWNDEKCRKSFSS